MTSTFYHQSSSGSINFSGKTLVIPVVSTANVGQLAADVLIASLDLDRVGVFYPGDLVPVIGAREDGLEGVTTALELYGKEGVPVCVIQQRSPALKSRKASFTSSLLSFISSSRFASVLFLSGVDSTNRTDSQMMAPIYHLLPPSAAPLANTPIGTLAQLPIPLYSSSTPSSTSSTSSRDSDTVPFIPGGGLTRRFLSSLPSSTTNMMSPPAAALLHFVLEGDNRSDAKLLATAVAQILGKPVLDKLPKDGWKEPASWKTGLFGTGTDSSLYG